MNSVYLSKIQSNINLLNNNIEKTTNQVASGRSFQEGSEDVEAFDLHLQIKKDLKIFKTISDDLAYGKNWLTNSENGIDTIENLLNSMQTSMSKLATNVAYDDLESAVLLDEFKGIKETFMNIANTQVNGQYIFSGTFTDRPPFDVNNFEQNPETLANEFIYQGDENSKEVYVDQNYKKDFSITGKDLFIDTKLFEKMDEFINLLENRVAEQGRILNVKEKELNELVGGQIIKDIYDDLQELDFSQLSVAQKLNITEYHDSLKEYIRVPTIENFKIAQAQLAELTTNPGTGAPGPWDYGTQLNAMFDLSEYNVSLNTYNNGMEVLNETLVNQAWPTGTDIDGASEYKFDLDNIQDLNNIKIDLQLFDPDGGVHIAINGVEITELPSHNGTSAITLSDLKGEVFSQGTNTLQIWSDGADSGNLESFKVYTDSNKDIFEQKDYILETYAAFSTPEQREDILYQYNLTMYKVDLKEYIENPTPENFDRMELSKKFMNNDALQEDIEVWKLNQKDRYEPIILEYGAELNTYVTQINGNPDVSAINDYIESIQAYMAEPTQENFATVEGLKNSLVGSAFTSTTINPIDHVENMFDYVEYLNDSKPWTDTQVRGEYREINDYMFNFTKNPFSAKIEDLFEVQGNISGIRGKLGNTYNYFETMEIKVNNKTLELKKFYSDNVDADMAETATRLTQETNALNALYSVVSKLQSLSLTNYLK